MCSISKLGTCYSDVWHVWFLSKKIAAVLIMVVAIYTFLSANVPIESLSPDYEMSGDDSFIHVGGIIFYLNREELNF